MAGSTFLSLTNKVLRHFNEVQLTSANFATATGFQAAAQDYVNEVIRDIQQAEYQWPFNWNQTEQVLTPNLAPNAYTTPSTCEFVDWESFFLVADATLTNPVSQQWLDIKDYDYWRQNDAANDYNAAALVAAGGTLGVQPPSYVFRTQDSQIGFSPIADQAYTISYEWWGYPSELSVYSDTTTIPSRFDHVIFKGCAALGYAFRGNIPMYNIFDKWKMDGISKMRELLINQYKTVRDNRLRRAG